MGSQPRLSAQRRDFQWLQGASKVINLSAQEPAPEEDTGLARSPIDLTGMLITMRARFLNPEKRDNDLQPIAFELSSDNINEIQILDQTADGTKGKFKIYVKTAVTKYIRPGCYSYTVEMVDLLGENTALLVGEIYFEART